LSNFVSTNYAYVILILLPFYALASRIAFRKLGYNYLEHFVINAYVVGQQAIIYSAFMLLLLLPISEDVAAQIILISSISYAFFAFKGVSKSMNIFKVVLNFVLIYLFFALFLVAITGMLFAANNL